MKKIILSFIMIYLLCYLVFVNLSVLKYNEMDFNQNGFVELSEAFQSIDIGTRKVNIDSKICIEYFSLKDGITIFDKCKNSS